MSMWCQKYKILTITLLILATGRGGCIVVRFTILGAGGHCGLGPVFALGFVILGVAGLELGQAADLAAPAAEVVPGALKLLCVEARPLPLDWSRGRRRSRWSRESSRALVLPERFRRSPCCPRWPPSPRDWPRDLPPPRPRSDSSPGFLADFLVLFLFFDFCGVSCKSELAVPLTLSSSPVLVIKAETGLSCIKWIRTTPRTQFWLAEPKEGSKDQTNWVVMLTFCPEATPRL